MGLIPNEQDIEKAEDHLLQVLNQWRDETLAKLNQMLDERQILIQFQKKQ